MSIEEKNEALRFLLKKFVSKETDLKKETKKGKEVNLEGSQLRENTVGGNDINGAPIGSKERESGERTTGAFIHGNFKSGPTIADVERNLATASLSSEAGAKNRKCGAYLEKKGPWGTTKTGYGG